VHPVPDAHESQWRSLTAEKAARSVRATPTRAKYRKV
jgi:hypothetical protein